jgi:hypothetical protein
MEIGSFFRRAGIVSSLMISSIGLSNRANAETILPADFFANNTAKMLELANYDSVPTTSNWDNYFSTSIKWNDFAKTNLSTDYRVWTLDANKKPNGLFDITTAGKYGLLHSYADDTTTPTIDEGAHVGDLMSVIVEKRDTGAMYNAQFVDASYNPTSIIFQGDTLNHKADILVDPRPIVPEPSGLALIVSSAIAGAGLRRFKK